MERPYCDRVRFRQCSRVPILCQPPLTADFLTCQSAQLFRIIRYVLSLSLLRSLHILSNPLPSLAHSRNPNQGFLPTSPSIRPTPSVPLPPSLTLRPSLRSSVPPSLSFPRLFLSLLPELSIPPCPPPPLPASRRPSKSHPLLPSHLPPHTHPSFPLTLRYLP
jgi:hypothetical protein